MLGTDSAASGVRVRRCTSFVAALVDLQSSRQRIQLQVCIIGEEGPEVIKHRGAKLVGLAPPRTTSRYSQTGAQEEDRICRIGARLPLSRISSVSRHSKFSCA